MWEGDDPQVAGASTFLPASPHSTLIICSLLLAFLADQSLWDWSLFPDHMGTGSSLFCETFLLWLFLMTLEFDWLCCHFDIWSLGGGGGGGRGMKRVRGDFRTNTQLSSRNNLCHNIDHHNMFSHLSSIGLPEENWKHYKLWTMFHIISWRSLGISAFAAQLHCFLHSVAKSGCASCGSAPSQWAA